MPPDWPLIRHIIRTVRTDPYGGIPRQALAETVGLAAYGRSMRDALAIAYRAKRIDYCGRYVVPGIKA